SFFFQAEDGIRDDLVTGVQTCALPICRPSEQPPVPVGIPLSNRRDVFVLRDVPARTVVVPALADRDKLSKLAASDDLADALLVRSEERRVGKGGGSGTWWRGVEVSAEH